MNHERSPINPNHVTHVRVSNKSKTCNRNKVSDKSDTTWWAIRYHMNTLFWLDLNMANMMKYEHYLNTHWINWMVLGRTLCIENYWILAFFPHFMRLSLLVYWYHLIHLIWLLYWIFWTSLNYMGPAIRS